VADKKIYLSEKEIPEAWYNIQADLPQPLAPPLNPKTGQPLGPEDYNVPQNLDQWLR